jgi:hypothetical protein
MKMNSEGKMAVQATIDNLLNDLRFAEQSLRRFEGRYQLSSEVFYELFCQGMLDDGQHLEEFAEWAGHYKLKLKRESALKEFFAGATDPATATIPKRHYQINTSTIASGVG